MDDVRAVAAAVRGTFIVSGEDVLGTSSYGEPFVCAVERPPVYGVQFHPEKSSVHGLRLLRNFAGVCASVAA